MINYKILDESVTHYESKGFTRIETPWTVTEYVDNITKPEGKISFQLKHNDKCLVASGEQSFLYLYLKEFLPKGKFQTITPCYRYDSFDNLHTKYFMKNELIQTDIVHKVALQDMVSIAYKFYRSYLPDIYLPQAPELPTRLTIKDTPDGYDIMYDDIELGSYGIRKCEFLEWIYGTGCAEPRLSNLIKKVCQK